MMAASLVVWFSVVGMTATIAFGQSQYCDKYNQCLATLEDKRSECIRLAEQRHANMTQDDEEDKSRHECLVEKDSKLEALKGLILRKTEVTRNCLSSKAASANPITNAAKRRKCDRLVEEDISTTPKHSLVIREADNERKGRKANKKRERKNKKQEKKRNNPLKGCESEAKAIKKTCKQLQKCCSVAKECEMAFESNPLHSQIESARSELKDVKQKCKQLQKQRRATGGKKQRNQQRRKQQKQKQKAAEEARTNGI